MVGDRIVNVNGHCVLNKTRMEIANLIRHGRNSISIGVIYSPELLSDLLLRDSSVNISPSKSRSQSQNQRQATPRYRDRVSSVSISQAPKPILPPPPFPSLDRKTSPSISLMSHAKHSPKKHSSMARRSVSLPPNTSRRSGRTCPPKLVLSSPSNTQQWQAHDEQQQDTSEPPSKIILYQSQQRDFPVAYLGVAPVLRTNSDTHHWTFLDVSHPVATLQRAHTRQQPRLV